MGKVTIKNILYATNFSTRSGRAFEYALTLARGQNARLHLLYVIEPMSDEMRTTLSMFVSDAKTRKNAIVRRAETARELLNERQEKFWDEIEDKSLRDQVEEIHVIEGFPAEAILKAAEDLPADMIVMGGHAHGLNHTFLGTVAKRVLRRSRIPTLIVPHLVPKL
ncbi:MAG: universal stress protein [Rhodobacterales bacterium]|nr:MAG: universal stress protein [Rhodobacterales bacterium]